MRTRKRSRESKPGGNRKSGPESSGKWEPKSDRKRQWAIKRGARPIPPSQNLYQKSPFLTPSYDSPVERALVLRTHGSRDSPGKDSLQCGRNLRQGRALFITLLPLCLLPLRHRLFIYIRFLLIPVFYCHITRANFSHRLGLLLSLPVLAISSFFSTYGPDLLLIKIFYPDIFIAGLDTLLAPANIYEKLTNSCQIPFQIFSPTGVQFLLYPRQL